ncbi:integrin alpha-PS1 isoform X2 [Adelges cooleyi]|uniref:integrin alpha-PS1 isoform X2 n=1 Tax=Adelges cooleyi TaxID=133065 RepID=UPI0021804DC6|nr:integrin alpha-PS1 isoform X2 [Adelges cooleyi]
MLALFSLPTLLVVYCTIIRWAHGFNLEVRLPIVKHGHFGSYFGYSVAGHQSFDDLKGQVENSWILVGAPLDQNLQPKTNQSGALWKCPLTTLHEDCEQVVTDGKRTIDSKNLAPPLAEEIKDGQWLGVTVRSQGSGGKVMVCAHRYITRGPGYQWGQGLCYTLTQNLDFDNCWEPCKGRSTSIGHEQFGVCQAGTSGILLEDDTIVIGSPGATLWRGTMFMVSISDDFLHRDKTYYYSPLSEPVDKDSYLGMSVTAGFFLGQQKMVYAAGAPRANGTGQVVLFTRSRPSVGLMDVKLVISGEQFASSFGYELATADLNGDKEPDLIVGAPFYFNKDCGGAIYIYMNNENHCLNCKPPIKLVGKPESRFGFAVANLGDLNKDGYDDIAVGAPYEGNGVVYIYLGSALGIVEEPSQVIRAENLEVNDLKTFGYSLGTNSIDLDQNGYPDLIAGAYESDMAVLIRARPIVDITTSIGPSENLKNIDPTKSGCFANNTSSFTCFTFEACCSLESVVKTGSGGEWGAQLHYKLEAETFQEGRKFSRVWFGPEETLRPHKIENNVNLDHNKKKSCQQHTVYLKEKTIDIQSPIALRITYLLVQNNPPMQNPGDPVPSLADLPVLNQNQAEKIFFATFHKDCGKNDRCESQLHVDAQLVLPLTPTINEYDLVMGQHQEVLLNTTVYNIGESAYECRLFVSHPYSFNYIGPVKMDDTKQVDCNPFNKTLVVCALGNPFKKSSTSNIQLRFDSKELDDAVNRLEFVVFSNSTSHEEDPQSPLILYANVIKRAELSLKGLARPEQVFYGGQIKDDLTVKYLDEVGSRVLHTYQVFNSGPWKVSNLEVHVDWPYQVAGHFTPKKWLLYLDEKPYVETLGGGECFLAQDQVNPLNLIVRPGVQEMPFENMHKENPGLYDFLNSKTTNYEMKNSTGFYQNRIRRDLNYFVGAETYTKENGKHQEIVKMNCLIGNAKCFKFRCVLYNLQKNQEATIFIKARLWNATLLRDFSKVHSVQIVSRAKIHVPTEFLLQNNHLDDEAEVETTAKVDLLEQQSEPIPLWIIILAILAGLLLFILLTLLLWKLGFFKRRRPDPTLSGNIEKHRVDDSYYDY